MVMIMYERNAYVAGHYSKVISDELKREAKLKRKALISRKYKKAKHERVG